MTNDLEHKPDARYSIHYRPLPTSSDQDHSLQAAIRGCTSEFVTFSSGESSLQPAVLEVLTTAVSHSPATAAALAVPSGGTTASWHHTPHPIAALWSRPTYPPLFRRSNLLEVADGISDDAPEWDGLIRLATRNFSIAVCETDLLTSVIYRPSHDLIPDRPVSSRHWLLRHLQQLDLATILPGGDQTAEAFALRAGLFQWHDYLDESHDCSQQIEGQGQHRLGDHWHAIMHRREPDFGNSQYWYRRVGYSPIFPDLANRAADVLATQPDIAGPWQPRLTRNGRWDACAFVDLCEASVKQSALATIARSIQEIEMELLFETTLACAMQR